MEKVPSNGIRRPERKRSSSLFFLRVVVLANSGSMEVMSTKGGIGVFGIIKLVHVDSTRLREDSIDSLEIRYVTGSHCHLGDQSMTHIYRTVALVTKPYIVFALSAPSSIFILSILGNVGIV